MTDQIGNRLDEDYDQDASDNDSIIIDHHSPYSVKSTHMSEEEPVLYTDKTGKNYNKPESQFIYGKRRGKYDRYKWCLDPFPTTSTRQHNITTHLPGLKGTARALNSSASILDFWNILFDDDIIHIIKDHTNTKITDLGVLYGSNPTHVNYTDDVEIKALIGLLYLSGVYKPDHKDAADLWKSNKTEHGIFRATMSYKRFMFLLTALRFDIPADKIIKKSNDDELAHISEIFQLLLVNFQSNYTPSEYMTVGEILVGFRGECAFSIFKKNKPRKCGLKIICLCDAKTNYLLNAFIYSGKSADPNPKNLLLPTLNVLSLIVPVANTNRNITGGKWFTSIELLDELKKMGLTWVGRMSKNKPEIPSFALHNKKDLVSSTKFAFTKDKTLVTFVSKKGNRVCLVSSMHHYHAKAESNKPEIIELFNDTKTGVNKLDKMRVKYSTQRRTRRWSMAIFFSLLDITGVNSFVLHRCKVNYSNIERRDFLISLGISLTENHIKRRLYELRLPKKLVCVMKTIIGIPESTVQVKKSILKRKRCYKCDTLNDTKYNTICETCKRHVCKFHGVIKKLCNTCNEQNMSDEDEFGVIN